MTIRATWNGAVLAESDATVVVEGNHYFPAGDVRDENFEPSGTHTVRPLKDRQRPQAVVDGARNEDAAWYYPSPRRRPARSPIGWPSARA